ncbi:MAG: ATP-binding protein [Thermodesulfobacteriota bacterium]|nr:ATP-binding protein [Thermodesulfobacteriota bacterium]
MMKRLQQSRRLSRLERFFLPALLVFCIGVTDMLPCHASNPASANISIKVGVYENSPKIFTDESGHPAGVFADILDWIAEKEGWRLEYVPGTWMEGLTRLEAGEIDLMPDVAYTAERAKRFVYHKEPVLASWFQVYVPRNSNIKSILDLNDKRIAVLEASVQQAVFQEMSAEFGLDVTLIGLPDYKTAFSIVARGDADATITNRFYGLRHAQTFNLEDTPIIFHPTNLFYAAAPQTPRRILDTIDARLVKIKSDPDSIYYDSMTRWITKKVAFRLPSWVRIAGITGGLLLLFSIAGSLVLKHQVNVRTRALQAANRDMEDRIARRTAELADAMKQAQAADRIKSAFLATMSHELRTPLNSIIGFTGIMLQELPGPMNPEQHKQMAMIQNSARYLLSLINDVLDISKIEAGQFSLYTETFEIHPMLDNTIKTTAPMAEKKGLNLRLALADDIIPTITADKRRLEQVLLNLLNNAVKFTEAGSVTLSCATRDGYFRFSVTDTGIGIAPDEKDGLFQPFHQIETGLARRYEGTGLGLSICKRLIEMMGGEIGMESRPGHGSTFFFHIPAASEASHAQPTSDH